MAVATSTNRAQKPSAVAASPYVSVVEFASYWAVSPRTVWRDISKGAIPIRRIGSSRRVRILRTVMESYGRPDK